MWIKKFGNLFLDLFFPKFCFNCKKEGGFLCEDCQALLGISSFHERLKTKNLEDLYFPLNYQNPLVKRLIKNFKYEPFVKELAETLSLLILSHFQLLDNKSAFAQGYSGQGPIIIPVPLTKKRLKWRGFNQAEEIAMKLAEFFKIPLLKDALIKTRETLPQINLSGKEREENIKGVFFCRDKNSIKDKKILLIDDVYTTGATMEECARVLKEAGAKEIIGIVIARG